MKKDDPYAGLYIETDEDPYAGLFVVEEPKRTGMDKATQMVGVTTNALAPYATAAGLGALATGVPTGGLGAPIGAAGAVLALGAGDLGTSVYNLATPLFGGDRIPLPSETISKAYRSVGIGRAPETPGEQVYSDVLQAASSAGSQAQGFKTLADAATSPQSMNFMRMMGQNTRGQTGAAIGAAGAPSVATNYFDVTNPYALMALSVPAAVAGGKAATPSVKPVTAAALKEESGKLYRAMEAEGVQIRPQAMNDLAAAIRPKLGDMRYDPDTDKLVGEALRLFGLKAGQPMSFDMLEEFRKSIRDLPYTQSGAGRGTPKERAIIAALDDTIDDFMDGLTPAQTTGDTVAANAFLTKARAVRGRGYQTETLENAFTKATATTDALNSNKSFPQALRDEFGKIAKDPRKLSKFDKPTQELIKKVANGTATQKILMGLGKLSPSARLFGTQMPIYGAGYGGLATLSPTAAAVTGGTQTLAAIAKGTANRMTKGQAKRALVSAAQPGGGIKPGGPGYFALAPIAQQNVLAQERSKKAAERRRMGF